MKNTNLVLGEETSAKVVSYRIYQKKRYHQGLHMLICVIQCEQIESKNEKER